MPTVAELCDAYLKAVPTLLLRRAGRPKKESTLVTDRGRMFGITAGTLYQKRYCAGMDLRTGSVVQFTAAGLSTALPALLFEDNRIAWGGEFAFALLWLVLVLSIGAVSLLHVLIRRGGAAQVASLFFLVPPCTALIAWPLFGETLGPLALIGMALTAAGVALAGRGAAR